MDDEVILISVIMGSIIMNTHVRIYVQSNCMCDNVETACPDISVTLITPQPPGKNLILPRVSFAQPYSYHLLVFKYWSILP